MNNSTGVDGKSRWLRMAASAITVGVLLAVPALGLAQFAPDLFAPLRGAGQSGWFDGIFALDGPTATIEKTRYSSIENKAKASDEILLLSDWNFTGKPGTDPQH